MPGTVVTIALVVVCSCAGLTGAAACSPYTPPTKLRVDHADSPIGLNVARPLFSWRPPQFQDAACRGARQESFAVELFLGNGSLHWQSPVVSAGLPQYVLPPSAPALQTLQRYKWRVQVTVVLPSGARSTVTSSMATFAAGVFAPGELWQQAAWIGTPLSGPQANATLFRTTVELPGGGGGGGCRYTTLLITGLGSYEAYVNGQRLGPPRGLLSKTLEPTAALAYDAFDVGAAAAGSGNVTLAVSLGSWWYALNGSPYFFRPPFGVPVGGRVLRALLVCQDADGRILQTHGTGPGWLQADGGVVMDDLFQGEVHDGRRAQPGWEQPAFRPDPARWQPAQSMAPPPGAGLLPQGTLMPAVVAEARSALRLSSPTAGVFVYDLGTNLAGRCAFSVGQTARSGVTIHFVHGEQRNTTSGRVIQSMGTPNRRTGKGRVVEHSAYITRGDGSDEVYRPLDVYNSFRYVEVQGPVNPPALGDLRCDFLHTGLARTGQVAISPAAHPPSPRANNSEWAVVDAVYTATFNSALSNFINIPTDCPSREKRGWLGDALAASNFLLLNFDMGAAYASFLRTIAEGQARNTQPEGCVLEIAPSFMTGGSGFSDPAWASALAVLLERWTAYYADTRLAAALYDNAMAYLQHLERYAQPLPGLGPDTKAILQAASYPGSRYGDWCAPSTNNTPKHVSNLGNGFYHILVAESVLRLAPLAGKPQDVAELQANVTALRSVFGTFFFNTTVMRYYDPFVPTTGSAGKDNNGIPLQTAQALALELGLTEVNSADERRQAAQALADNARELNFHAATGLVGNKYVLRSLQKYGFGDAALSILAADTQPSLGFMALTEGSLWEQYSGSGSWNHIMLGSMTAHVHEGLAGLEQAAGSLGWANYTVAPFVTPRLGGINVTMDTVYGEIGAGWVLPQGCTAAAATWTHQLVVPTGASAQLQVPLTACAASATAADAVVREGGALVWNKGPVGQLVPGVQSVAASADQHTLVIVLGSGSYTFEVEVV